MAQAPPGGGHKLFSLDDITKLMNSFNQPAVAMPPPPPPPQQQLPTQVEDLTLAQIRALYEKSTATAAVIQTQQQTHQVTTTPTQQPQQQHPLSRAANPSPTTPSRPEYNSKAIRPALGIQKKKYKDGASPARRRAQTL